MKLSIVDRSPVPAGSTPADVVGNSIELARLALKVAEVFRTLHALYPNRVDVGLGRAPGGTQLS